MKRILKNTLLLTISMALLTSPVFAKAEVVSTTPCVLSVDENSGVKIIRDAAGGIVVSGLPTPYVASLAEQQKQLAMIEAYRNSNIEQNNVKVRSSSDENYYDYEDDPIYIGTWQEIDCYARHTLGSYNSTTKYLTSYGDCSWYNTSGYAALPYRNGNATVEGQDVVDVAKNSYFDIRDLTTDTAMTLRINDWGPNQDAHPDRIADIDKNDFVELHGNSTDGLFYCRTWVPVTNYNP